ncbi:MAG: DUF2279 domain-containing protein [Chitinophagaceae bacterium]|nr:MAG: DUF2279 domain-containing protein [Chitinophagaceae bacterium]
MKPTVVSLTCAASIFSAGKSWFSRPLLAVLFLNVYLSIAPVAAQDTLVWNPNAGSANIRKTDKATSAFVRYDTISARQQQRRVRIIAAANVAGYGAVMAGLYQTWYKNYSQGKFHTFNDIGEWQQMDKLGHVYSAYAAGKASMELWRWTGIDRKKRIWIGGMSGAVWQTTIEVLDGFSSEWGWSWGDFAANVAGSGLLVAQELAWDRQRIQMKWSFHRKRYSDAALNRRSDELFGKTTPERILKDYNGQTYWLSAGIKDFFPKTRLPDWLQLSIGTGADGMFGGYDNLAYDEAGNIKFDRRDIKRYRQWYLAPDIDLTRIKTNKKGIRMALYILNIFKFPTPSLELSNGKLKGNWLHF